MVSCEKIKHLRILKHRNGDRQFSNVAINIDHSRAFGFQGLVTRSKMFLNKNALLGWSYCGKLQNFRDFLGIKLGNVASSWYGNFLARTFSKNIGLIQGQIYVFAAGDSRICPHPPPLFSSDFKFCFLLAKFCHQARVPSPHCVVACCFWGGILAIDRREMRDIYCWELTPCSSAIYLPWPGPEHIQLTSKILKVALIHTPIWTIRVEGVQKCYFCFLKWIFPLIFFD